jgi:amino acid adenylation domain-containing protein
LVVGLLAILKTGGAYVPLDPAYPKDRTSFIVGDAGVATLLTTRRLEGCVAGSAARILCFEEFETADLTADDLNVPTLPNDLAYVLFTSGSAGRPKGVSIRHQSVVALASWASAQFSKAERAGVLASTSICFDLSVFELLVTLATGGTVIMANNALALHELPARDEVTLINTVPSVMDELIRLRDLPPSVVTVNLAGEPLDTSLVDRIYQHSSVTHVYDLYGPSETTTYSTCALRAPGGRATIGRPIANTRVYVLDDGGQPVPVGVAGQLYIGGLGLARDYWHRPELTAERFVVDPTGVDRGGRLYRTGDVVRYFPDGSLEFLGRQDDQVKLRGYRIELGEIETVLRAHTAVREAVVLVAEDRGGNRCLSAYLTVTAVDGAEDILRSHLRSHLPDYMIPSVFVVVESLPILPNGKIDRQALRALDLGAPDAREGYIPPVTSTEQALCDIWSRVLGIERVGIQDGFFTLGGHSLLVIQVVVRIREVFGVDVPLRQMFDASTVAAQADFIDTLRWMGNPPQGPDRVGAGPEEGPPFHAELL